MLGEHFSNLQSKTSLGRCVSKTRYHFGETTYDDLAAIGSVTGSCEKKLTHTAMSRDSFQDLQGIVWNRHLGDFVTWDVRNPYPIESKRI